jgi:hypothetical protein
LTTLRAKAELTKQFISKSELQLKSRVEAIIEIKRENTDLHLKCSKLVADLHLKEKELKEIKSDYEKTTDLNQKYTLKF